MYGNVNITESDPSLKVIHGSLILIKLKKIGKKWQNILLKISLK
jgi:hypothetical protein